LHLIGSVLFFAGGVFNYWRAWVVIREERNLRGGNDAGSSNKI